MYYGGFDITFIIFVLPATILAMYAQFKVNSTFNKYSRVTNAKGLTGADVAKQLLAIAGIYDVQVEAVAGNLTDHYDPRAKVLRLSQSVYGSTSLAAIGVAAHETGHAVQHDQGYVPLNLRSSFFPVFNISSKIAPTLIMVGILLTAFSTSQFGILLLEIGIVLFSAVVLFQIITLPVEFNASSRAIEMLADHNILSSTELVPAKKVLSAAALTYVAAAIVAVANLLRFVVILSGRNRD